MSINNISGISKAEFERLMIDDPDFAKILMAKNKGNISISKTKNKSKSNKSKSNNISKQKPKDIPKNTPVKPEPQKPKSKDIPKNDPHKNISKVKPEPKKIAHKTNDPNKATNDPNTEPCKDPNCNICEKPEPQKSEPKKPEPQKPEPPKNISDDLSMSWRKRLAKLTYKYPKVAYVYDYYINKQNGVTADLVKENILFYEDLKKT